MASSWGIEPPINDTAIMNANQFSIADNYRTFTFEIWNMKTPLAVKPGTPYSGRIVEHVDLAINPQEYQMHEPTRQGITQTISGAWVDYYGLGLPKIVMSGTTGWHPFSKRADPSQPPTGLKDFLELRNLIFRQYASLLKPTNVSYKDRIQNQYQLRFYSWDTGDYCLVLIDDFVLKRSATRPLLFDYQISMTVIGYLTTQDPPADFLKNSYIFSYREIDIKNALNIQLSLLDEYRILLKNISKFVADGIATVQSGVQFIADILNTGASFTKTTLSFVRDISKSIKDLDDTIANTLSIPISLRNDTINTLHEMSCALSGLFNAQLYANFWSDLADSAPWRHLGCSSTMVIPVSPLLISGAARTPAEEYRYKEIIVREGDTADIILSYGGASSGIITTWQEIVQINDLEYPYIVQDTDFIKEVKATTVATFYGIAGTVIPINTVVATPATNIRESIQFKTLATVTINVNGQITVTIESLVAGDLGNVEVGAIAVIVVAIAGLDAVTNLTAVSNGKIWKVLKPGDKIRLPVLQESNTNGIYVENTNVLADNLFGIDLALDDTGDFESDPAGDLAVNAGIKNIIAAMQDRLKTESGELIKHPEYGVASEVMVGKPGDKNAIQYAQIEISRTVSADARIKRIDTVRLNKQNDVLNVTINAILIDEVPKEINITL